jgi:putative hydrolase of the HAD superfamily
MQTYASHVPQVRLFADAARALEACTSAGITLGLVTDGQHATQRRKVAALGIAGRFAEIVYTGALGPDRAFHKPHPLGFETIAAAIGSPGDRFVYVGDNPARDFLAPNALGWTTVMVDRPAHRAHRIHKQPVAPPGGEARHVIASLDDLPPLLMA